MGDLGPVCPIRPMAYQGYGGGIAAERIRAVHTATLGAFMPDLTLILDLPTEEGLARAGKRLTEHRSIEDRYERMERDFHNRLREGFLKLPLPSLCVAVSSMPRQISKPLGMISSWLSRRPLACH